MPEWSNGTVSKTVVLVTVPGVRIPLSPQERLNEKQALYDVNCTGLFYAGA